jgi:hypothetical protein
VSSLVVVLGFSAQEREFCKIHVMARNLEYELFASFEPDSSRPDANLEPDDTSWRDEFLLRVRVERPMRLRTRLVDLPVAGAEDARRAQVFERVDRFDFFFGFKTQVFERDVEVLQDFAVTVCFPQLNEDVEIVCLLAGQVQDCTRVASDVCCGFESVLKVEFLGIVVYLLGRRVGLVGETCVLFRLEWRRGHSMVKEQSCVPSFGDGPVCKLQIRRR